MNRTGVVDYASAENWLKGARSKIKTKRSLYSDGLYLQRETPDSISIVTYWWNGQSNLITYYSDGSVVIHPREMYQSIRRMINEYVPNVVIVMRKFKLIVSLNSDGKTPSKLQQCRRCKGKGYSPRWCYGPMNCEDDKCVTTQQRKYFAELAYTTHRTKGYEEARKLYDAAYELSHLEHGGCKHLEQVAHEDWTSTYDCWPCGGSGQRDYGRKRMGRVWNAQNPIGIDKDGNGIEMEVATICL